MVLPNQGVRSVEEEHSKYHVAFQRGVALVKGSIQIDGQRLKRLGFFEKIRLKRALRNFEEAALFAPDNAAPPFMMAKIRDRLGDFEGSLELLKRANLLQPDNLILAIETGAALGRLGKHREAATLLEVVSRSYPDEPRVWCNLGLSYLMTGETENAVRAFELLVRLEPSLSTNQKLLDVASEAHAGRRAIPRSEAEVVQAMSERQG